VTFVVEFAAQGALVAAPVQSWVFAAIPSEPIGFQSRHGVRHHLVVPEEHERTAASLALEPLDFWPLPSDVARRSNHGVAVLPLDPAALQLRIKVRPDALAQVLNREGVVALAVKYSDERSPDSAETPPHNRYRTETVLPYQTHKDVATVEQGVRRQSDGISELVFSPFS
jgi:hypothetical protein